MLSQLKRHPESQGAQSMRMQVDALRPQPEVLSLRFVVAGPVDSLSLPPAGRPERGHELWRHTCFEAFVRTDDGGYYEFNLAPSRRWAAYRFRGYRDGMAVVEDVITPPIASRAAGGQFELRATLHLDGLGLAAEAPLRVALSTVLEEREGGRSYWALAHPPGKPDFHHPDSFVLELP